MNQSKTIGIILAGGESRRFGSHKAFAIYNNKYFFEYAIDALQHHVDESYIVSHPTIKNQFQAHTSIEILEDFAPYQGLGPLVGIFTVMKYNKADWYVVSPCDTPGITGNLINQLLTFRDVNIDAVIPVVHGQIQPLTAVYHYKVIKKIEKLLVEKQLRMKDLLSICNVTYVEEKELELTGIEFQNINRQVELKNFMKQVRDITS